jgi:hypothetical protein
VNVDCLSRVERCWALALHVKIEPKNDPATRRARMVDVLAEVLADLLTIPAESSGDHLHRREAKPGKKPEVRT